MVKQPVPMKRHQKMDTEVLNCTFALSLFSDVNDRYTTRKLRSGKGRGLANNRSGSWQFYSQMEPANSAKRANLAKRANPRYFTMLYGAAVILADCVHRC